MSETRCMSTWNAAGKEHSCILPPEHIRKCECDCGERGYALNTPPAVWQPKPFYKRRKQAKIDH